MSKVIRNKVLNYIRSQKAHSEKNKAAGKEMYSEENILSDPEMEEMISNDWKKHVTSCAMENVRKHFSGLAIQVFEMSLRGLSHKQISGELNIAESSVRTLKGRVQQSLIKEIGRLKEEWEI